MHKRYSTLFLLPVLIFTLLLSGCIVDEDGEPKIPTKSSMEGVWVVTEAISAEGDTITNDIALPVAAFHLSSDNTVIGTAAPMWMYVVYGKSKYVEIASKIDQVFNYAGLDFNGGEFFIGGGQQERFTMEMKLEGLPGQKSLTTLLDLIGITQDYLDVVVYHKFQDVKVGFEDDYNTMTWEFDDITTAIYNTKDNYGNYVLWEGWPINKFSKCTFVLEKRTKDLKTVVQEAL